jgi:quinol-cytochrome oxidoreductase complex cytochrome b subunit
MWDIVGLHATLGTLTALLLIAGVVLTRVRAAKRWRWVYGVALFLVISATGFVGGVLAHGQM